MIRKLQVKMEAPDGTPAFVFTLLQKKTNQTKTNKQKTEQVKSTEKCMHLGYMCSDRHPQ